MNATKEDVKFERFPYISIALDYIKAMAPERVFVEIGSDNGVCDPFRGRYAAVYVDGKFKLKRYGVEENDAREVLHCEFSRR